jgi:hypothetical protein
MSKKFAQMSALAFVLAAAMALPASAVTEDDAAAPQGAFTSSMTAPMPAGLSSLSPSERRERFAKFRQERIAYYRAQMREKSDSAGTAE